MSPIDANLDIPDTDDLSVPEVEDDVLWFAADFQVLRCLRRLEIFPDF